MREKISSALIGISLIGAVVAGLAWMYFIWTFDWGTSYRGRGLWLMVMLFGAPLVGLAVVGVFATVARLIDPEA